ncbi:helicase HerA-like domain-containing protein [Carnimonas bestiolae]|uniref:helicase HerA-like domain-containing protein n=1 Tax=Carnimonas bestiolae TaxID=3402172 RepID=UPI003EDBB81F
MQPITLGKSVDSDVTALLQPKYANRHGLVAGATGTGKTVTLMTLAEGFSRIGVPVFMADVKGDVAGLSMPGKGDDKLVERAKAMGIEDYAAEASPTVLWDIYGKKGHPVRTTISEMGPTLLSRVLELNDTQSSVLEIAFKVADDQGLLLLDFDDLRAILKLVSEERKALSEEYGLISAQTVAAIQRSLLGLEKEGATQFFGEPALELDDLMRTDSDGRGVINILASDQLVLKPRLYSTFLLWVLSELFEQLPEVGDADKPKLAFIFDEAHLLFDDAPDALMDRIEQVVRLIRSKGVGVYFCSQFPDDMPGPVLGQLGNRIQHALRAYTPRDQKAVKTAAETFPENPKLDVKKTISTLGTGEALVSLLDDNGVPTPVEHDRIAPPRCRMGAISDEERQQVLADSPFGDKYDTAVNRESAAELLAKRAEQKSGDDESQESGAAASESAKKSSDGKSSASQQSGDSSSWTDELKGVLFGSHGRQGVVESVLKQGGRQLVRGLFGNLTRRK